MLLKKMNLENFRQFIGTQSIDFSTEPDRNVTIILGENGSGKTTLAQAFTWCLYGDTDFDDKNVLNKKVAQKIGPNGEASVKVELNLKHMEIEYTIIREQKYTTDATGNLKRPNNSVFKIAYRNSDGQQEFIRENETEVRMKQILPKELSKYFFFDGERIGNMSKEIKKGKSPEFAEAVKSLLGLSAFTAALDHLNGRSSSSVIKSYDEDYDSKSDSKIARYREEMKKYENRLAVIEKRLEEIDNEELTAKEKQKEYEIKLVENKDSEKLANERTHLLDKIKRLEESKIRNTHSILENFNKSGAFWMAINLFAGTDIDIDEKEEVIDMCKAWEEQKNEGRELGREEGRELGREEGRIRQAKVTALKLQKKGHSIEDIAECVDFDEETVKKWLVS